MDDYHLLADTLAADIASGHLLPGERLPAQRQFARRRGIANSTAARVYRELIRRGLAVGEVGRGTFVRAAAPGTEPALAEPSRAGVDLELNFPLLPDQPGLLAAGLERMRNPGVLASSLRPVGPAGTPAARSAASAMLRRAGWSPSRERVLFAGNGRQAIAAAVAALVSGGERLGVEALTYPVVKGIAARLGITLVPLAMDEYGLVPEALAEALPLRAVYLQPTLHNPLGMTMPAERRAALADTLCRLGLFAVEDTIYSFLGADLPPLAALAPERTVVVDSLSKRLAPGLTVGFVVPPDALADRVAATLRSGTWTAPRFALDLATQWMTDGTVNQVVAAKRQDAAVRQRVAAERLAELNFRADAHAYHGWWELPEPWRAETFVAAAARRGIAVTPGAAFAVATGHAPNAVRLALASPPIDVLAEALDTLATLAKGNPDDLGVE